MTAFRPFARHAQPNNLAGRLYIFSVQSLTLNTGVLPPVALEGRQHIAGEGPRNDINPTPPEGGCFPRGIQAECFPRGKHGTRPDFNPTPPEGGLLDGLRLAIHCWKGAALLFRGLPGDRWSSENGKPSG